MLLRRTKPFLPLCGKYFWIAVSLLIAVTCNAFAEDNQPYTPPHMFGIAPASDNKPAKQPTNIVPEPPPPEQLNDIEPDARAEPINMFEGEQHKPRPPKAVNFPLQMSAQKSQFITNPPIPKRRPQKFFASQSFIQQALENYKKNPPLTSIRDNNGEKKYIIEEKAKPDEMDLEGQLDTPTVQDILKYLE